MVDFFLYFGIALLVALFLGPVIIPQLKKMKFGQAIREEGPEAHLSKSGTPTMGGLIFIVAFMTPSLIFLDIENSLVQLLWFSVLGFGAIGFTDDYLKVVKKHNLGLKARQKIVLQLIVGIIISVIAYGNSSETWVPFLDAPVDLGLFFIPFIIFISVGFNNAVNLTDGIDGLAASVTSVVALFFASVSFEMGQFQLAAINLSMVGALVGYLKFNWYPARVFMGDTGSLALGGYVVGMAIVLKMPLILVLTGIVYVLETLSVMIQVVVYKRTGKRVFKMSPIHHHFELSGWHEKKVVYVFTGITFIGSLVGYVILL